MNTWQQLLLSRLWLEPPVVAVRCQSICYRCLWLVVWLQSKCLSRNTVCQIGWQKGDQSSSFVLHKHWIQGALRSTCSTARVWVVCMYVCICICLCICECICVCLCARVCLCGGARMRTCCQTNEASDTSISTHIIFKIRIKFSIVAPVLSKYSSDAANANACKYFEFVLWNYFQMLFSFFIGEYTWQFSGIFGE